MPGSAAFSQEDFERAVEAFSAAPFDAARWIEGLDLYARAGGGHAGQIIGVSVRAGLEYHWASGFSDEALLAYEQYGGGSPAVNPRAARALFQPVNSILGDDDCLDADARRRSPIYQELFRPHDADFAGMARLANVGEAHVLASVLRSAKQGHSQRSDHERMARLLPHITAALQVHARLEGQGARLAVLALDALSLCAFLCDGWGRIVGMTGAAEALLAERDFIHLSDSRLSLADAAADGDFQAAVRRACGAPRDRPSRSPGGSSLTARDASGQRRLIDVGPLPDAGLTRRVVPAAVILVAKARPPDDAVRLLRRAYGLTEAEAAIALDLADGLSSAEIAGLREAATSTVRGQIQAVLNKVGVRKASALASTVTRFRST